MNAIAYVHEQLSGKKEFPAFKAGDNITVNYKIIEGNKERIQSFKGDVIKKQGTGHTASFTVRKISDGVGVERVFLSIPPISNQSRSTRPVTFVAPNCSTSVHVAVKVHGFVKREWRLPFKLLKHSKINKIFTESPELIGAFLWTDRFSSIIIPVFLSSYYL